MLLQLDFGAETPIYQQIRNQVVMGIADGGLSPGDRLPTIRALAVESGINMMTVSKAYQLLKQEGYISTDRRSGAIISCGGAGLDTDAQDRLRLIVSEAKLGGMSRDEFLGLVGKLCDELEV